MKMSKMSTQMQAKRILAVDPGYERLGIAVIENNTLLFSDCFQTNKELSHAKRLKELGVKFEEVIEKYAPDTFALETLFFSNNQKTALLVSETRGMLLYLAEKNNLHIREFSPAEVKIGVTGYGKSTKQQVMSMVPKILSIKKKITLDDEFDAIAVGVTCAATKDIFGTHVEKNRLA